MKVRAINKHGYIWDFDSIAAANEALEADWRQNACEIKDEFGTFLEVWLADVIDEYGPPPQTFCA